MTIQQDLMMTEIDHQLCRNLIKEFRLSLKAYERALNKFGMEKLISLLKKSEIVVFNNITTNFPNSSEGIYLKSSSKDRRIFKISYYYDEYKQYYHDQIFGSSRLFVDYTDVYNTVINILSKAPQDVSEFVTSSFEVRMENVTSTSMVLFIDIDKTLEYSFCKIDVIQD